MIEAEKYMIGEPSTVIKMSDSESDESAEQLNNQIEQELRGLTQDEVIAFVDGSYNSTEEKSGFGVIIIDDNNSSLTDTQKKEILY